ncbi:MAG: thioredoxin family protein [Janthinobacterium lividum]
MPFNYSQELIDKAINYSAYRQVINDTLAQPSQDETAEKMRPYIKKNVVLMEKYDESYQISNALKTALEAAPATIWLVLTEGWCGDAAFNVPMLAAIEKAVPEKVQLRFLFRDSNLELMDANLTDGCRSIPKLIVLSKDLKDLATWGPRPDDLQLLMKGWKNEGLALQALLPKVQHWYDADQTKSIQKELTAIVKSYA